MRYEEQNVCKECVKFGLNCKDLKKCNPVKQNLRQFNGIRHTADGFDCALPVTIDSHSYCAYECLYCFSDNLQGHTAGGDRGVGQTSLAAVERIFAGGGGKFGELVRRALRYDRPNAAGYPTPVQLGGLTDPCDSIEQNQGWLLKYIDLAIKYNQPTRISTKGAIFLLPEYKKAIAKAPHLFWVAFSMITDDDVMMRKIDRFAPDATTRLRTMKVLSDLGVRTSLRFRPVMYRISDIDNAHLRLIDKAADAGARAVSYEVMFYPNRLPTTSKWKYQLLDEIGGVSYKSIYRNFGKMQACTRPSYLWTEQIMHEIRDHSHKRGMDVGVSDPVWKQLSDFGCCCGINPEDEVFGNWEVENATNALIKAKNTGELIYFADICPDWADDMLLSKMVNLGAGPKIVYDRKVKTWADKLRENWNIVQGERSVMNYFQGALKPVGRDENGDLIYKYEGLKRGNNNCGFGCKGCKI